MRWGVFLLALSLASCPAAELAPVSFVNPFVGTDKGGDVFPGAVVPFGLVQLTPNWSGNGYYWTDTHLHGFVLNSLSGDGGDNEGEGLITATTGPVKIDRASTDFALDHGQESASAGYYQVRMNPWDINAELTASAHCGCIRFTFPAGQQANILLPVCYANRKVFSSHVRLLNPQTVAGDVSCESFYGDHLPITVYFVMAFSKPFTSHGTWNGDAMKNGSDSASQDAPDAVMGFYGSYPAAPSPQEIDVRIGVSYTDSAGAMANLKAEMPADHFDVFHRRAVASWNKELRAIQVEGGTTEHNRIFYTALYHCLIQPLRFDDIDGRYRGFDEKIHHVRAGHHFYADFSGWDIYRSEIPLLTIIAPQRVQDMAQSVVEEYKQIGYVDRWSELNRATNIMNGDPMTIVLAHIWNAGLHNFDLTAVYPGLLKQAGPGPGPTSPGDYEGYDEERNGVTLLPTSSVSTALEHYMSFAALGRLAATLGKPADAKYLDRRASEYRSWYNPATGFLQRKNSDGTWDDKFGGYTEGNKWIYLWFVPFDIDGLVHLLGGPASFERRLDGFFANGSYDPTNEPDLQAPFLYDFINRPWKTQQIVAKIADQMFTDTPGGLAGGGNDDLGTMSAWYILTQLGFYPVNPGVPQFETCTPRFKKITLHLGPPYAGRAFVIRAPDAAPENTYIESSILDGRPLAKSWFDESQITRGGEWQVKVGPTPEKAGDDKRFRPPYSLSLPPVPMPAIAPVKSPPPKQSFTIP
jgi:predicted alpha-1,2-mannosidase